MDFDSTRSMRESVNHQGKCPGDSMKHEFEWQEIETVYREARKSTHGEELRWLVNRETIVNKATNETIVRSTLRHPGICVIVPFAEDDQIILMHQYRYAADGMLWEL